MPLHIQLVSVLIAASIAFCLGVGVYGAIHRKFYSDLPSIPQFPGSKFPGFFVQFYTAFFIISFGAASIADCVSKTAEPQEELQFSHMLLSMVVQIALYLPLILVYFSQPSRMLPGVPLLRRVKWVIFGLMALCIPAQLLELAGLTEWIVEVTGCPSQQEVVEELMRGTPQVKGLLIFMAVFVAPVTEECCFRGCVYNILKHWSSPLPAALASAMLFGAVHASLAQFIPLTIFGLVQCYLYEKARSLWLPITLHMLFNAISAIAIISFS